MKSIQIVKQVNNTELGKFGTKDTYILIPQDLDISDLFEEKNVKYSFKDKSTDKEYKIRFTEGKEKRIVGMGPYYRDNDVMAGDKILLEKRVYNNHNSEYYVSLHKETQIVFFQKVKKYFEALTPERVSELLGKTDSQVPKSLVKVEYYDEIQKRNDSPVKTKVYNIYADGRNIQSDYKDRDMIGLIKENGQIKIIGREPWKKYVVEVNE